MAAYAPLSAPTSTVTRTSEWLVQRLMDDTLAPADRQRYAALYAELWQGVEVVTRIVRQVREAGSGVVDLRA